MGRWREARPYARLIGDPGYAPEESRGSVQGTLASAASAVTGALDLSKQNAKWLAELDALEKCAANPTSQVSKSDPNYSRETVARVPAARSELKEVNAVRYLNQMTETGSGITPATAVLSVGLKQGFSWNEKTSAVGNLASSGRLMVIDDPAAQKIFGFGYSASGQLVTTGIRSDDCGGKYNNPIPLTIDWLPYITGYPGTGGAIEGERTDSTCTGGNAHGQQKTKFQFSAPPAK